MQPTSVNKSRNVEIKFVRDLVVSLVMLVASVMRMLAVFVMLVVVVMPVVLATFVSMMLAVFTTVTGDMAVGFLLVPSVATV